MIKVEEGERTVAEADIFDLSQAVAPHIIGQRNNNKEAFLDYDEQRLRDELIEKATARLQRRMLEERLSNVMRDVIQMQSQLEFLRVDASATIDAIVKMDDNEQQACRLEAIERRLQTHQDQLDELKKAAAMAAASARAAAPSRSMSTMNNATPSSRTAAADPNVTAAPSPTASAFSMSRLSSFSLMSSLFSRAGSTTASSSCTSQPDEDDDCCSVASFMTEEQQRTLRMRRARQRQQQQQQQQQKKKKQQTPPLPPHPSLYPSTTTVGTVPTTIVHSTPVNTKYYFQGNDLNYRDDARYEDYENNNNNYCCALSDIGTLSSASSMSRPRALYEVVPAFAERFLHSLPNSPLSQTGIDLDKRNALDDALSFLDSLSENADDGGFGEDMDLLLRHPELCCRSLSEVRGAMAEIRRGSASDKVLVPSKAGGSDVDEKGTAIYQWTSSACAYSWKWYKFLSILTAAVTISVLKGPDDMLDEPV
ncbi:hypothetical protein BX666DRAFT_1877169 [Dichotomocladium elegans]|nr:hypothetical protein BX666DRAFT_1877169 [Dichotomocladium elegans]